MLLATPDSVDRRVPLFSTPGPNEFSGWRIVSRIGVGEFTSARGSFASAVSGGFANDGPIELGGFGPAGATVCGGGGGGLYITGAGAGILGCFATD